MMNKLLLAVACVCLLQSCLAAPTESNMIDKSSSSTTESSSNSTEAVFQPAADIIGAIYRRAIAKALHEKVSDLQAKLFKGENAIPVAMDILRYALFSNQAQDTMKKITDHVLSIMSPEMKKQAADEGFIEETTPMTKVSSKVKPLKP